MAFIGRRKTHSRFHVLPLPPAGEKTSLPLCTGICSEHLERRVSRHGPFFKCNRCQAVIPENEDGEPSRPVGVCSRCHAYVYPAIGANGAVWLSCSKYWLHTK